MVQILANQRREILKSLTTDAEGHVCTETGEERFLEEMTPLQASKAIKPSTEVGSRLTR